MFRFVLDGENYLVAEVALRFAISFCRCINLNRSRVDAITLGSRMLTISSDPVTILRISFDTSARVNTLLMIPISKRDRTTPVTVPLPPWTVTPPKNTAAIALSSNPVPLSARELENRNVKTIPANALIKPEVTNSSIFSRLRLIPEKSAAVAATPLFAPGSKVPGSLFRPIGGALLGPNLSANAFQGFFQGIQRAEMGRQHMGDAVAHVPDAQAGQQAPAQGVPAGGIQQSMAGNLDFVALKRELGAQ